MSVREGPSGQATRGESDGSRSARVPFDPVYALIAALPWMMFYWQIPWVSGRVIGNDYLLFAMPSQMELRLAYATGEVPLFVPGFCGGQTAAALMLGQPFHPLPMVASHLPGYWSGHAIAWTTLLRILSLAPVHALLYAFLRRVPVARWAAFVATFVAVYNLRMLDLFRYGASMEAETGMLLVLAAAGHAWMRPSRARDVAAIAGSTAWLVCSGHPQMTYYAALGVAPLALAVPWLVAALRGEALARAELARRRDHTLSVVVGGAIGVLLSAAFLVPLYFEFIRTNAGRVAQTYAWADNLRDTFTGTLCNFVHPLRADVHGAFGASSLLLVAALLPIARAVGVRVPRALTALWLLSLFYFAHMQGGRTLVHRFVWSVLPFASSFRVAGRIAVCLPPTLMFPLAWILAGMPSASVDDSLRRRAERTVTSVALALLALTVVCDASVGLDTADFSPAVFRAIPGQILQATELFGVVALAALAARGRALAERTRKVAMAVMVTAVIAQTGLVLSQGTWVEDARPSPTLADMLADKGRRLAFSQMPHDSYNVTVHRHSHVEGFAPEPFLSRVHAQVTPVRDLDHAYARMRHGRAVDELIVIGPASLASSPEVASLAEPATVTLAFASFNRVVFEVTSPVDAFVSLAFPFAPQWRATVDGRASPSYRANGAMLSTPVRRGRHRVEWRYESGASRAGVVLSCLGVALLGLALSRWSSRRGVRRWVPALVGAALAFALFAGWRSMIYGSRGLPTRYAWRAAPADAPRNLAYGHVTRASTLAVPVYADLCSPNRAVDGSREPGEGGSTAPEQRPWWSVDLGRVERIGALALFLQRFPPEHNQHPLRIAISNDGVTWSALFDVPAERSSSRPVRLSLGGGVSTRFVKIELLTPPGVFGRLMLDEVELYEPRSASR